MKYAGAAKSIAKTAHEPAFGSTLPHKAHGTLVDATIIDAPSSTKNKFEARDWRCCPTLIIEDSHCESMRLDRLHEQAITRPLPHDELVQLHCVASQGRVTADLAGSGHDVARAACWPLWPPCRVL